MSNWMIVPNDSDIFHYGIPKRSGRYPYGSGDRPFQSSGGKRPTGFFKKAKAKKAVKKAEKERAEKIAQKKKEMAVKKAFEQAKEVAINSGDTKFLMSYRSQLSNDDIKRAIARIDALNQLNTSVQKSASVTQPSQKQKKDSGSKKKYTNIADKYPGFDAFTKNENSANNWAKTYVNAYGTVQDVLKILNGTQNQQNQKKKK